MEKNMEIDRVWLQAAMFQMYPNFKSSPKDNTMAVTKKSIISMEDDVKTKHAIPVVMGMLAAVLFAVAFLNGVSAWIYILILLGWWAGVTFTSGSSRTANDPEA
jgi:1,4-dihydroxy-2-naphthoate octaprenyltransferase